MLATLSYGSLCGDSIGIIMREAVRRAMVAIRRYRFHFEEELKANHFGKWTDVKTNADSIAQAIYIQLLKECFPTFGIAAEENNLSEPCTHELNIHFTVDPLDGTRAFTRRQSHGIGTMLSLICSGSVLAAYVGDVMSQEIYGYRPGSDNVWRFDESTTHSHPEKLLVDTSKPLKKRYVLLTDAHYNYSKFVQHIIGPATRGGFFDGYNVMNGSIGTNMAQLWKSEVAAMILKPHIEYPWDFCPTYGISRKLGFLFCKIDRDNATIKPYEPVVRPLKQFRRFEVIILHENYFDQMSQSLQEQKV